MKSASILIVGGGIGGLTCAIAMRRQGFSVDLVEKDPTWSVYGVGIIQQSNVVRAVAALGILKDYIDAGFGFDFIDLFMENGHHMARIPAPKLAEGFPANVGIGRPALHKVLGDSARSAGAKIRLGVTVTRIADGPKNVKVHFTDGTSGRYDIVVAADGLYSWLRSALFPDAAPPQFTGQGVWRHNFRKPTELDSLHSYAGSVAMGLVPLSPSLMYLYMTTPEPGNPFYARDSLASTMRAKLASAPTALQPYVAQIVNDADVVYRPLEWQFLDHDWFRGRVILIGDAAHATSPHLGQGAGMAIEDSLVLAEELASHESHTDAFHAFQARRHPRCKYIVERSRAIGEAQIGTGPQVDYAFEMAEMFRITSQPL